MIDLPFIWACIIAFSVLAYVVLDGFDLGVGILFGILDKDAHRDTAMNTIAPIWDGNETWLILGGGGLLATFPLAYAVVLPALYAPIIAMLLGLVFRGVAFEFRWKSRNNKLFWDRSFVAGSFIAAFAQGIALGALVQGITVVDRAYAGGWWDWLTPFSLLTGVAVVIGYALLGATWLILKTEGELQAQAIRIARIAGVGTLALIGIFSLWTPFLHPVYMQRWFSWPQILYVAPVPILVSLAAYNLYKGLRDHDDARPFFSSLALFILCFAGLGVSFFPYIVPPNLTIWDAAAPDKSLSFLLIGTSFLLPMIIAYTGYSYWVFRGKVREGEGYH